MALRSTQVYVQALGITDNTVTADSTSLIDAAVSAEHTIVWELIASSLVEIVSDVNLVAAVPVFATSALEVVQVAHGQTGEAHGVDELLVEDGADVFYVPPQISLSAIVFTTPVELEYLSPKSETSPVLVAVEAAPDYFPPVITPVELSQQVVIAQTVPLFVESNLTDAEIEIDIPDVVVDFQDGLSVVAEANASLVVTAQSEVILSQEAHLTFDHAASSVELGVIAAGVSATNFSESSLALQTFAAFAQATANASDTQLSVKQSARFVYQAGTTLCHYTPFVGASSDPDAPTPPPTSLPAASELSGFRLLYPAEGTVTDEVVLRGPNLGNVERISLDRINRETRGGTLVVFADPIWPKIETLLFTFSALKRAKAYEVLGFIDAHLGVEIRLIDHEDRAWKGVIINPQDPVVQDNRNLFTAGFEFEGSRDV